MATADEQKTSTEYESALVKETFKLLKSGEKEIQLLSGYRKVVLVVGDTGNGKTKFTKWIAGDSTKLIAEETVENSDEFIINDIQDITSSTMDSDTVYPKLVIDETNVPYYDCPGFNDTRSTSNDVATTYFIKKIADFVDSVKIIFIINFPSVRKGVDRHNFVKLLRQATEFIRNVEKFKNSFALIVTKVDNLYAKGGASLTGDTQVIENIAAFLEEVKQALAAKIPDSSHMERRFYEDAIKLVSYLLNKDGKTYKNVGLFRRPDRSGPISEIPLLQEERIIIKRIIDRNLTFTEKVDDDFGYTISEKSKNDIGCLVEEINKRVWSRVGYITDEITKHYSTLTNEIRNIIKCFSKVDSFPDVDQIREQELSSHLRKGHKSILDSIKYIENVSSPYELTHEIKRLLAALEIGISSVDVLEIEKQGRYFNFLQVVSNVTLNTRSWDEPFKRIVASISAFWLKLQEAVDDIALNFHKHVLSSFELITNDIQKQLDEKIKVTEIQQVPEKLNNYSNYLRELVKKIKNTRNLEEWVKIIRNITSCMMVNVSNDKALNILKLDNYLNFLQIFSERAFCSLSSEWVHPFQNLVKHLNESKSWYKFLDSLYNTFSEYEMQKNRRRYDVADIKNWGNPKGEPGICISKNNFLQFLEKISKCNISEFEIIKNISLTDVRIEELNEVLNLTLKQHINIHTKNNSISITGGCIRTSDFLNNSKLASLVNSGRFKFINIFAFKTLFVDEDLTFPGLNVGFIAPKWETIGNRKIKLDGANGARRFPKKAKDGNSAEWDGKDGEPGLPGKPGGTFFGIGETFVNCSNLTITANGGNGGLGQHGGDGVIVGSGGNGGIGGKGGNPGVVILCELNLKSEISINVETGSSGIGGSGGLKRLGSLVGNHIMPPYDLNRPDPIGFLFGSILKGVDDYIQSDEYKNGVDGANKKGLQSPEPANTIAELNKIVEGYNSHSDEYLNSRYERLVLFSFLNKLNESNCTITATETFTKALGKLKAVRLIKSNKDYPEPFQNLLKVSEII